MPRTCTTPATTPRTKDSGLPAPFATPPGKRIGEIWFEPPADLPQLLVKYLFTSEKLSVQVHPSDTQTEAAGLGRQGKDVISIPLPAIELPRFRFGANQGKGVGQGPGEAGDAVDGDGQPVEGAEDAPGEAAGEPAYDDNAE